MAGIEFKDGLLGFKDRGIEKVIKLTVEFATTLKGRLRM